MYDTILAESVAILGHNGDWIEAYVARPLSSGPVGSVVVIHHMPGYDRGTKEMVRRLADAGFAAIVPNLYHREAPGASPDDAAATARAKGGVPDERLVGDVEGAATHLRNLTNSNGKVGVIGHCSGGRQSVLAACSLDLQACVDCYGAFVVRTPGEGAPLKVTPVAHLVDSLSCPILGMFGLDDQFPTPDEVKEFDEILTKAGKQHDFHSYEGAGHAFFAADRPSYRPDAAVDGWAKILSFYTEHLQ